MGKGLGLMEGSGRMVGLPPHWSGKGVQERDRPWWEWAALFSTGEKGQIAILSFQVASSAKLASPAPAGMESPHRLVPSPRLCANVETCLCLADKAVWVET